jgi:hypothetical protein
MTDKSNFTPEEWKLLLESVMMAGIAVTAAEPSGLWGMLKESLASGSALAQTQLDPRSGPLVKAVVADFETPQGQSIARGGLREKLAGRNPAELKAQCIETLRQAGALIDSKAPDDAPAFKGWLREISQHVAEASKEGGFLGIGGVLVSDAEKATLTEISSVLGLGD